MKVGNNKLQKIQKMKRIKFLLAILSVCILPSCLSSGLEELPVYNDAEITNFKFEYRWAEKEGKSERLRVKPLNTKVNIDKEKAIVVCQITVPAADAQAFTEEVRNKVAQNNIVGFCTISTAATIRPVGSAPHLGKPGDFTQNTMSYEVIAADKKTKKTWMLIVESFNK